MEEFFMKPKVDFAFKEIMENEEARKGFLAAALKIAPTDIKETRILNPYLRKIHADEKLGILDVRVMMNNNTQIDTEINLSKFDAWAKRSLFYLAKMYTDQINPGDSYSKLMKCVNISILDFNLFPDESDFYSCFHLREDTRYFLYTDQIEFHVLELPKLPEELKEDSSDLLLWAKFINAESKEEFEMLAKRNPYINSAYQQLQIISQDQQKRMEYEAREKALRDHIQIREEGIEEGFVKGEAKGEQNIIQRLLKTMSPEQVSQVLEMPLEDIQRIANT